MSAFPRLLRTSPARRGRACLSVAATILLQASAISVPAQDNTPAALNAPDPTNTFPKRLRRADSFLGIHFDFHAGPDCDQIGRHTTRAMIENIISQVKPDYIQIDCKGHRGLSSYPTKVGNPAPGFVGDPLRLWRQVTAEHGVALYMHYSGVADDEAIRQHPDWAAVHADGKPDARATSLFSPYVDQLMVPQLKELRDVYGVDGVWVDGDCWAAEADYRPEALEAFKTQTGLDTVPRAPGDPNYYEFMQFNREAFRRYLAHYVSEVKKDHPDFQIASNWAYSQHMPEPVGVDVDFLSGDYSLQNSVNSARLAARCLAPQGQPWDLMAWAFSGLHNEPGRSLKSVPQLEQEAAEVLSLGGGFQAYFKQKRDGSIYDWQMKLMAEVARFCRERQAICHHAKPVPQIALLYSSAAYYREASRLFAPWNGELNALQGVLQSLLDSRNSVEVLSEHHLKGRLQEYPLVVVPEWNYLEPDFVAQLKNYVVNGGKLLLIGPGPVRLFRDVIGATLLGEPIPNAVRYVEQNRWLAGFKTTIQPVELRSGARSFARMYLDDDPNDVSEPAASTLFYGRGKIGAIYLNLGERYLHARTPTARNLLEAMVRNLFPEPMVEVSGSSQVEVAINRKDGKLAINLINTSGPHANGNVRVFDEVPPLGLLALAIHTGGPPRSVTLEPGGRPLNYDYSQGTIRLTLPQLEIHNVIVVE